MTASSHPTLSDSALHWVTNEALQGARMTAVERMKGGISSLVHAITVQAGEAERHVVLRQFDNADWVREQPDIARQEADSLRIAARARLSGVMTPELIAFDETGAASGMPAVLMSRLEGKVVLEPADMSRWLDRLAAALARVHRIEADDCTRTFAPYSDAAKMDASAWSKTPGKWREAVDRVMSRKPVFVPRFIHRDYHPANVLWQDGEVSGVVDWVNGCIGPAGIDVGHCRVNLALLHGVEAADGFLDRYRMHAGETFAYEPHWDLVTLLDFAAWPPEVYPGWTDLGMSGLTVSMMEERLDLYLGSLLNR